MSAIDGTMACKCYNIGWGGGGAGCSVFVFGPGFPLRLKGVWGRTMMVMQLFLPSTFTEVYIEKKNLYTPANFVEIIMFQIFFIL